MKRRYFRQILLLALSFILTLVILLPIKAEDLREFEIYRNLEISDQELGSVAEKLLTKDLVGIDLETFEDQARVEQLATLYRGLYLDSVIYHDRNLHYMEQLATSEEGLSEEQIIELQEQLTWLVDAEYVLELALKNDLLDDLWDPDFDTIDSLVDEQAEIQDEAIALRAWVRVTIDQMWDDTPEKQREALGIVHASLQDLFADLFMNLRPDTVADTVVLEPNLSQEVIEHFKRKHDLASWIAWLDNGALGSLPKGLLQNTKATPNSLAREEKTYGAYDSQGRSLMAEVIGEEIRELIYVVPMGEEVEDFLQALFKEDFDLEGQGPMATESLSFHEDIYHIQQEAMPTLVLTKVTTPLQVIMRLELK